jgi:hypothetical protein
VLISFPRTISLPFRIGILSVLVVIAAALPASSQDTAAPVAGHRVGPVSIEPTISVTNFGMDTNVFNNADQPERDLTATVIPKVQASLGVGPARLTGTGALTFVYFNRYASQRSIDGSEDVKFVLPMHRVRAYAAGSFLKTHERTGYDIGIRSLRIENNRTAGADLRLTGKAVFTIAALQSRVMYEKSAVVLGTSLDQALNRNSEGMRGSMRYMLTPLTTAVLSADVNRDRFEFSPLRNADAVRVAPGIEFTGRAVIVGKAYVGYRQFHTIDPVVPDFTGVTSSVDLSYTMLSATRFTARVDRDVDYSYEPSDPFFIVTGINGIVERYISRGWDWQGQVGRYRLSYRSVAPVSGSRLAGDRIDTVLTAKSALGYRLRGRNRMVFNVEYERRQSLAGFRRYSSLRVGTSLVYSL